MWESAPRGVGPQFRPRGSNARDAAAFSSGLPCLLTPSGAVVYQELGRVHTRLESRNEAATLSLQTEGAGSGPLAPQRPCGRRLLRSGVDRSRRGKRISRALLVASHG